MRCAACPNSKTRWASPHESI